MSSSSAFHSVFTNSQLPQGNTGTPGDVWWVSSTGLLWFVVGDGSLYQLLESVPIPVAGPQGVQGPTGPAGEGFFASVGYFGTWSASPTSYQAGAIVSFNGFLYMSTALLNLSNNEMAPAGNPFWQILGAVNTTRSSSLEIMIDGAGLNPTLGTKGFISVPFAATITGWYILANGVGSCGLDVKYSTLATFPSTVSIVNGSNPALSSAQSGEGSVSAWTVTSLNATDVIEVDLISCSGAITFVTLAIQTSALN
jgi:hypothetical protein